MAPAMQTLLPDLATSKPCVCRLFFVLTLIPPLTTHVPMCIMVIIMHCNFQYIFESNAVIYNRFSSVASPVWQQYVCTNYMALLQDQVRLITSLSWVCNNGSMHIGCSLILIRPTNNKLSHDKHTKYSMLFPRNSRGKKHWMVLQNNTMVYVPYLDMMHRILSIY